MGRIIKTIALRFADGFAPVVGTIKTHEDIIHTRGYVWYGKIGSTISKKAEEMIFDNPNPRILLIHSGTQYRYWAYIDSFSREEPLQDEYPSYYRDKASKIKAWFRVVGFERASSDVMSRSVVVSSGRILSEVSKKSMSPYFMIHYTGDIDE